MVELRHAFRTLGMARGFALAAVASLALGIGANVAMFSLVNAILLRPLPYPNADRLAFITTIIPKVSHLYPSVPVNASHFVRMREQMKTVDAIGTAFPMNGNLTEAGPPENLGGLGISHGFMEALGVTAQLGHWFTADEDKPGGPRMVVISDSLWRLRFSANPSILGAKIILSGRDYQVIGVAPRNLVLPHGNQLHVLLKFPARVDFFLPARFTAAQLEQENFNYAVVAALKHGATIRQAQAELDVVMASVTKDNPERVEMRGHIQPLHQTITGDARQGLVILLVAVGLVLLIVCVNVANLTLVRATGRRRDLAIRAALGASKPRLIAHSLAESFLLSVTGGTLGVLFALWIKDLVISRAPIDLPRLSETTIDGNVLAFAVALSLFTALLSGMLPALRVAAVPPQEALQSATRGNTEGPRGGRLRTSLVALEVALSTVLLICAGLLLTSFQRVLNVNRGFEAENIVSVDLALPGAKYQNRPDRWKFYKQVRDGVYTLPGIVHAGYISYLPLTNQSDLSMVDTETNQNVPMIERPIANWRPTTPAYFPAMGIALKSGRLFMDEEAENVTVISEGLARRVWPGRNPVGEKLRRNGDNRWFRIVGVVGDVRSIGLDKEPPIVAYLPLWQRDSNEMTLVVRSAVDPSAIAAGLRETVWAVDRDIPVPELRTMARVISDSLAVRRFQALLVTCFAAVALLLASIGIYGIVAYSVLQRRAEIGVRLAMGATHADVMRIMLRNGMAPVAIGLVAGVVGAAATARLVSTLLFQVRALDPFTFVVVPLLLAAVGALACYVPARRVTRVDPLEALRYE